MNQTHSPRVLKLHEKLNREAEEAGYHLNPDKGFASDLVAALLTNQERYGYWACPCRLAFGVKEKDLDIICPCDYRDADLNQYGTCYCALYVTEDWISGRLPNKSIPERRPEQYMREGYSEAAKPRETAGAGEFAYPVWRCKVCGYLCARDEPPGVCPVCKAKKDRFERFT